MVTTTIPTPFETDLSAEPVVDQLDVVAPHHTAQRQQQITKMATQPIKWQEAAFRWIERDKRAIDAFRRLLLRMDRYHDVLRNKRLVRQDGNYGPMVGGLAALAHHHGRWIRSPEDWTSTVEKGGEPQRIDQFASLARHLLTRYHVPSFMDEAWFGACGDEALRHQEWFIHIGSGGSVRDLDLPVKLTRSMAHKFMQGMNRKSIARNLRWAQVLAMGGDWQMARTIQSTRLGRHLDDDEFWSTVVLFLTSNPLIDPTQVGPMIDYIHNMRFAPRRVVGEGGGVEEAPPPQPDFTMKGRSATKLLRQVEAWHGHLTSVQNVIFQSWQPSGVRSFALEEQSAELGAVRWTVQELLSSWELAAEGTAMGHCVVSYSDQCADGKASIWSIGLQLEDEESRESVLTVAFDVRRRAVTQARGRYNMVPNKAPRSAKGQEATRGKYKQMLDRSDHILSLWTERERVRREDK